LKGKLHVGKWITTKNEHFRPDTEIEIKEVVFRLMLPGEISAALGDMIAWLPAIKYVAENYDFVAGHLIVPAWFMEIATNVMRPYPHWRIHANHVPDRLANGFQLREQLQIPNATGMHLVDLGFTLFCGINPPPEGARDYLELDLEDVKLRPEVSGKRYAVLTPCETAETRAMTKEAFDSICDHLVSLGITPVFLGKSEMIKRKIKMTHDLSKGINLLDKTSLLEAAKIMKHAEMVIGIDNGLLHLAGMTDATILYGYTIAGPEQRRIPRKHGLTYELYAEKSQVPCIFCQERVRYFLTHNFKYCIYGEKTPTCVRMLNAASWVATINQAIKGE